PKSLRVVRRRAGGGQEGGRKGAPSPARHERYRQHPQERKQRERRSAEQQRMQQHSGTGRTHEGSASRVRRSCSAVTARIIRNSRNATADAEPRFHHLKPSSYMKYSTLTVLC